MLRSCEVCIFLVLACFVQIWQIFVQIRIIHILRNIFYKFRAIYVQQIMTHPCRNFEKKNILPTKEITFVGVLKNLFVNIKESRFVVEWARKPIWDFCAFRTFQTFSNWNFPRPPCTGYIAWLSSTNFVIGGFVSLRLQLSLGFLSGDLYTREQGNPLKLDFLDADRDNCNNRGGKDKIIAMDNSNTMGWQFHDLTLGEQWKKRFFKYNS